MAGLDRAPVAVRRADDHAIRSAGQTSQIGLLFERLPGLDVEASSSGILFVAPVGPAGWSLAFRWSPPRGGTFLEDLFGLSDPLPAFSDASLRPPPGAGAPTGC